MAFTGLFITVLLLCTICVAGLALLWVHLLRDRRVAGNVLPRCGHCGYTIYNSASAACPECGSSLAEVGFKPAMRVGPVRFLILWTVLLLIPAFCSSSVLSLVGPYVTAEVGHLQLRPISSGYRRVEIKFKTRNVSFRTAQFSRLAHASLLAYGDRMVAREFDLSNTASNPVNETDILSLLQAVGANPKDAQVVDEAKELLSIVQNAPGVGLPSNSGLTHFHTTQVQWSKSSRYPHPAIFAIGMSSWLILWVGGILLYRKLNRDAKTASQPVAALGVLEHPSAG